MNYYTKKALKKYQKIKWSNKKLLTNIKIIKALYCIELVHRNLLWRLLEYFYWILFPKKFSYQRILTIGKFQIKTIYLKCKSKIKNIFYSNKIETVDELLYNNIPNTNWESLSDDLLKDIVTFYNGDKTGNYINSIKILVNSKQNMT
jgi:hypothetical protein